MKDRQKRNVVSYYVINIYIIVVIKNSTTQRLTGRNVISPSDLTVKWNRLTKME